MANRKKLTVRKRPRQGRSVATVEAILRAATYILTKRGWGSFTTNEVAARAGVNIASLYQYFPNKESIVAELQRRHVEEMRRLWPAPSPAPSLKENVRLVLEAVVSEHRVSPALHRAFAEELPRAMRRGTPPDEAEARWAATLAPFLKVPDPELAKFIVGVAVHAVIHEAASDRPELLDHPLFVSELVRLLTPYLAGAS